MTNNESGLQNNLLNRTSAIFIKSSLPPISHQPPVKARGKRESGTHVIVKAPEVRNIVAQGKQRAALG